VSNLAAYLKRHHLALVALFFALGGTSFAAAGALVPKNSVGSTQVINGSLKVIDFNKKQRASLRGPRGLQGPAGVQGPQGAQGPQGQKGVVGAVTVKRVDFALNDGTTASSQVACPAGTKAIGGGATVSASSASDVQVVVSRPYSTTAPDLPVDGGTFNGWRVVYYNAAGSTAPAVGNTTARVFAICAET